MPKKRQATENRKTRETDISVSINLDGAGKADVKTGIPFLDHMLTLLARHGFMDLKIKAKGDIEVDHHHTAEDVGISLGNAFGKALGDKAGIFRYGHFQVPMDEALAEATIDL